MEQNQDQLDHWLKSAKESGIVELRHFGKALKKILKLLKR